MTVQQRDIFPADKSHQTRARRHVQPRRKFKRQALDACRSKLRLHRCDQLARRRQVRLESVRAHPGQDRQRLLFGTAEYSAG
jgi:hypothetical protein